MVFITVFRPTFSTVEILYYYSSKSKKKNKTAVRKRKIMSEA